MRRIPPYIDCILQYYLMETCGQITCTARTRGTIRGATRNPLHGGGIAKRGGGLASTTPRFHPFLNAPTKLMETCGQIACSVWTLPIRFTVGTGGTIGGAQA